MKQPDMTGMKTQKRCFSSVDELLVIVLFAVSR